MESSFKPAVKAKRTLTDAQRENLKKGREKLMMVRRGEEYKERVKKRRQEYTGEKRKRAPRAVSQKSIRKAAKAISAQSMPVSGLAPVASSQSATAMYGDMVPTAP